MPELPVLYTFRRCPYAIRARMALAYTGIAVELREVLLKNKPPELITASTKGTVPVLVLPDGTVLDESIDIMHWALAQADPDNWLSPPCDGDTASWLAANDGPFKHWLDRYKYADRYPEQPAGWYRSQASPHLEHLDDVLRDNAWLHGERAGIVDVALFPFIRQFAMVDYDWFAAGPYPALRRWLEGWLAEPLFLAVMQKLPRWEGGQEPTLLISA